MKHYTINLLCIQVNEVYRYNNRRLSTTPIQINLTPPPNLIVSAITHPSTTFSGVLIVSTFEYSIIFKDMMQVN
jgi:hypothetical protein